MSSSASLSTFDSSSSSDAEENYWKKSSAVPKADTAILTANKNQSEDSNEANPNGNRRKRKRGRSCSSESTEDDELLVSYKSKPRSEDVAPRSTTKKKKRKTEPNRNKPKKKMKKSSLSVKAKLKQNPDTNNLTTILEASSSSLKNRKKSKAQSLVFDLERAINPQVKRGARNEENEEDRNGGYQVRAKTIPYIITKGGNEKELPTAPFYDRNQPPTHICKRLQDSTGQKEKHKELEKEEIQLLLEQAVAPILRRLGWKIGHLFSSFKFRSDKTTTYTFLREEMMSSLKRVRPKLESYGDEVISGVNPENDSILETLILEDILTNRSNRLNEFRKVVEASVEYHPSYEEFQNAFLPTMCMTDADESMDNKHDHLNNFDNKPHSGDAVETHSQNSNQRKKSLILQSSFHTTSNNSPIQHENRNTREIGNRRTTMNYIKIVQALPNLPDLVNASSLEEFFVFATSKSEIPEQAKRQLLNIKTCKVKDDPWSLALVLKGAEEFVTRARQCAIKVVKNAMIKDIASTIFRSPESFELQIKIDATQKLGIIPATQDTQTSEGKREYIPFLCRGTGQMLQILGKAVNKGAILTELRYKGVKKTIPLEKRRNALSNAKLRFQKSGNEDDKWMIAKISLSGNADLSQLNLERVITANSYINRRNGKRFKLHAHGYLPKSTSLQNRQSKKIMQNGQNGDYSKIEPTPIRRRPGTSKKNGKDHLQNVGQPPLKKPKKDSNRDNFILKMKRVREIEFAPFKISHKLVKAQMWDAHKRMVGEDCSENCRCPSMLGNLTKSVIRYYLQKQHEKGDFKNLLEVKQTDSMVGFANRFCGKFYPKVRKAFPEDTHHQTLQRLYAMWDAHIMQRRFGSTCEEECECGSSWTELFLPVCEKWTTLHEPVEHADTSTKKRRIGKEVIQKENGHEPFIITITPSQDSLGLFLTNVNGKCIVSSIDLNGFAYKKSRNHVKIGVSAIGISTNNSKEKIPVHSWQTIEEEYNNLKKTSLRMSIWFTKKAEGGKIKSLNDCKSEWSSNGAWIGNIHSGWAGGARLATSNDNEIAQGDMTKLGRSETYINFRERISQISACQKATTMSKQPAPQRLEQVELHNLKTEIHVSKTTPKGAVVHKEKDLAKFLTRNGQTNLQNDSVIIGQKHQLKSILRTQRDPNTKSKNRERRVQIFDENHINVSPSRSMDIVRRQHLIDCLIDTRKTVVELVKQMKKAPISQEVFIVLNKMIQERLEQLQKDQKAAMDQEEYDEIHKSLESLNLKKIALIIFELVGEAIDMVRYITNPSLLTFTIAETNIKLCSKSTQQNKSKYTHLYCTLVLNKSKVPSSSAKVTFNENVNWLENTNKCEAELSVLHVNSQTGGFHGKDEATISLMTDDVDGNSATLGVVNMNASELISLHSKARTSDFLTRKFEKNDLLENGKICLIPQKKEATPEKIKEKKEEIRKKLNEVIPRIESLRSKYGEDEEDIIGGDICSFDNVSLLHTAVACCEKDFVSKLLKLGARTSTESKSLGTPVAYARRLVKEEMKDKERRRTYHGIIQMLDQN